MNILDFSSDSLNISTPGSYNISLPGGIYFLECWGSKGTDSAVWDNKISKGGSGGYSSGVFIVDENSFLFAFIGGIGTSSSSTSGTGGFNGGGSCGLYAGGGGGATDFRTGLNLETRILVAGGGGGAEGGGPQKNGGSGGGIIGFSGIVNSYVSCYGTQSGCDGGSSSNTVPGSLGNGGGSTSYHYTGGGGGYYGGGSVYASGGGGGSGFIGGVISYYSYQNITLSGEETFLSPSGISAKGNDSQGYSRITLINSLSTSFEHNQKNSTCLFPFIALYFSPVFTLHHLLMTFLL